MCTLAAFVRCFAAQPLIVLANRDERLDRPQGPITRWTDGPIPFVAPTDLAAGGTWLGVNANGLFVGLTNRFGVQKDPTRRSRGLLAVDLLGSPSAKAAAEQLRNRRVTDENAFHALVADRGEAFAARWDGDELSVVPLGPGIHMVTERSFDAAPTTREPWVKTQLERMLGPAPPDDGALEALLSSHREESFEGTCVHLDQLGYGTRCSTIIRLDHDLVRLRHADGPPCRTQFASYEPCFLDAAI